MPPLFPQSYIPQAKTYNPTGEINPATGLPYIYGGAAPATAAVVPTQNSFLSSNNNSKIVNPAETPVTPPATRSKYINPATGAYFTPDEYANYVAGTIPKGDIPKTASDAITNPNQSTTQLEGTARNLNNARNDLAVGETSMFAGSDVTAGGEQIIYSPAEKDAIRKAAAGIYDPALNDVFARLKEKQALDKKKQDREDQIFATNENIRQWRATTGLNGGGAGGRGRFTQTQLNTAARNSGLGETVFSTIDDYDIINYFVSPPKAKDEITQETKTIHAFFKEDLAKVKAGEMTVQEAAEAITSSPLPESVKQLYLDELPLEDVEKKSFLDKVWGLFQ